MNKSTAQSVLEVPALIAPKELAQRWRCGRSSVDRIARRNGFARVCLGEGKNGMVRYLRKEVEAYEQKQQVRMN